MERLLQDLRYSLRMLVKHRGFTAISVIALALGIGANTAIFSVVYTVLLRPLPFPESDRLVVLAEKAPKGDRIGIAYPNYKDLQERAESFEEMASYLSWSFNLTGIDKPVRLKGRIVDWNFFQMLGVKPQLGRMFVEQDDRPDAPHTAMISNGLWKERFGGDPNVIDRIINVDGNQFTLIGVLPPDFEFLSRDDLYVPIGLSLTPESNLLNRGNHFGLYALARLKRGVTVEQAQKEVEVLAAQLEREYPNTNSGNSAIAQKLVDMLVEEIRPALLVLLGAVGFVLLIACVNVANLLLVRMADRQREIALRLALGAGRGRIIQQLLSESVMVSVLGGLVGLLLGVWMMNGLLLLAPPDIPRLHQVGLNYTVLIFTLCVSVLTGLLFGTLPALHAARTDLHIVLKEGGRSTAGSSKEGMRKVLLVAEVGLALVLLIGTGLMLRTVFQLTRVNPGFNPEHLLTMRFSLPQNAYNTERRLIFYRECLARIEALPGVRSAALSMSLPIDGSRWNSIFIVADKPIPPRAELPNAAFTPVSSNYFGTMGIQLLKGRTFSEADMADSPHVIVINETLAHRLWPNEDPIGKRLKQGWPEDKKIWCEVVGVVSDIKLNGVNRETPLQAYLPLAQEPSRSLGLVVRIEGNPLALASTVEQAIYSVDKDLPLFDIRSMDQLLNNAIGQQRLTMMLLAGFAILALTLAAVGIYGVMSYAVAQRTHEIGIRMALGAQQRDVLKLVVRQGMTLASIGIGSGLVVALALTRVMSSLLFSVSATDPATFAAIALLLTVVALLACYLPARRATKVDPMVALKYE
jgi:putative ABC transport system permease protein